MLMGLLDQSKSQRNTDLKLAEEPKLKGRVSGIFLKTILSLAGTRQGGKTY